MMISSLTSLALPTSSSTSSTHHLRLLVAAAAPPVRLSRRLDLKEPPSRLSTRRRRRTSILVSASKEGSSSDKSKDDSNSNDAANDANDDDDAPPTLRPGAWRDFRASLVASAAAASGEKPGPSGDIWSARWTPENVHLLQEQDREGLAREPLWVHALEGGSPEVGGLLIATPEAVELSGGDQRRWQLVCYVTKHDTENGNGGGPSTALILNRPATAKLGDLLGWGLRFGSSNRNSNGNNNDDDDEEDDDDPSSSSSSSSSSAEAAAVEAAFGDSPVYLGGFFSPARIAAQPLTLLHGISGLPGATEVSPGGGVFSGGVRAAAAAVVSGGSSSSSSSLSSSSSPPGATCRLFAGEMSWPSAAALEAEVRAGLWYAAASSRAVVLKPCLGLPVPLWRECLGLMGGEYARVARRRG